jgi:hypothetical protein
VIFCLQFRLVAMRIGWSVLTRSRRRRICVE